MTKGDRRERQAKKFYESLGYEVHKKVNNRHDRGDIFDLFDLFCVKKEHKPILVQVKSNSTAGWMKQYDQEADFISEKAFAVELAVNYDYNGWRIIRSRGGDWEDVYDERKKEEQTYEKPEI